MDKHGDSCPWSEDPASGDERSDFTNSQDYKAQEVAATTSEEEANLEPIQANLEPIQTFHCSKCLKTFVNLSGCRLHVKEKKCLDIAPCPTTHEHELLEMKFKTMNDALKWMMDEEMDKFFITRRSSATRRVFHCFQNHESTSRKVKKTKKVMRCSARIVMRDLEMCNCNNHKGERCLNPTRVVLVQGCIKHSHSMERSKLRLSKRTKDRVAELLRFGLSSNEVLEWFFNPANEDTNSRPLTKTDIHEVMRAHKYRGDDLTASEVPNNTADQIDHHGLHPNSENMSKYSLECSEDGRFKIREELSEDETGDAHSFTLEKNPISCNSATCSVLCPDCPKMSGCVHQFTCDCKAFTSRKLCKHSHVLALLRHANQAEPSARDVDVIHDHQWTESSNHSVEQEPRALQIKGDPVAIFLRRLTEIETKVQTLKEMMRSDDVSLKEKNDLMKAVGELPIEKVSVASHSSLTLSPRRKKVKSTPAILQY